MISISKNLGVDMARLAQSVERGTFNPEVKGSSPLSGDDNFKKLLLSVT